MDWIGFYLKEEDNRKKYKRKKENDIIRSTIVSHVLEKNMIM